MLLFVSLVLILFGFVGIGTEVSNLQDGESNLDKFIQDFTLAIIFLLNGLLLLKQSFKQNRFSFFSKKGVLYISGFFLFSIGVYGFFPELIIQESEKRFIGLAMGFSFLFMGSVIIYLAYNIPNQSNPSWRHTIFPKRGTLCNGCGAKNHKNANVCNYCGAPL